MHKLDQFSHSDPVERFDAMIGLIARKKIHTLSEHNKSALERAAYEAGYDLLPVVEPEEGTLVVMEPPVDCYAEFDEWWPYICLIQSENKNEKVWSVSLSSEIPADIDELICVRAGFERGMGYEGTTEDLWYSSYDEYAYMDENEYAHEQAVAYATAEYVHSMAMSL